MMRNKSAVNNWWTKITTAKRKRTIVLDFDGVLHRYSKGYTGTEPEEGTVRGSVEFVRKLIDEGWTVVVCSARLRDKDAKAAVEEWLHKHHFPELKVVLEKPPAEIYVDDNGYRFDGDFDKLQRFLKRNPESWAKG
jgi:adenylylsulfate kinase-like enzyme